MVYEVQSTNWEDNSFDRNLWIADVASGETRQLTSAKKSSTNAAWSPDGKWIAFLSDRPAQISGSPDGQKAVVRDFGGWRRSPAAHQSRKPTSTLSNGRRIRSASPFPQTDPEPKSLKDRKEKYGEYSVVHADYQMAHLWTLEIPDAAANAAPEAKRLTEGNAFSVGSFAWSPDGTRIAFSAQRDPDLISSDFRTIFMS